MALQMGEKVPLYFELNATELAAGTAFDIVAPVSGVIHKAYAIVQTTIVTGGDITLTAGDEGAAGTAVAGLTLTIADALAKGNVVSDTPTEPSVTRYVDEGDRITVVPSAGFNGGGAVSGYIIIETGKTA